jgi:hypothetical protein
MKTTILSTLFIFGYQFCKALSGITPLPNPLVLNQRTASMTVTTNGTIYCGKSNGLMKHENNTWTNFDTSNSTLNSNSIILLNWSVSNQLLITTDLGITIFDGVTFVNNTFGSLGVPNQINAIEKVQNNLWIGTDQGLYKHDGTNLTAYNVSNNKLNNDTVLQLKFWNNDLWAATKNGLTKIDNSNNSFTYLSNNSALKQNYIYDVDIFQNKLYISYKADFNDFLNVQYFNGTIFSQLNDVAMKTKIDRYYQINKIKNAPEGLLLGDMNGEILYFNSNTKLIASSGSNFPALINMAWHSTSNSIAISYLSTNKPITLLDFSVFDCFGCENLPRNNKYIDINNVRANMQNRGVMNSKENVSYNDYLLNPGYEFPKGTSSRIYLQNTLWLGGLDNNSNLHLAAQTYQQNGNDFWPGPINISTGTTDTATAILYDKIWKINRFDVEEFKWAFTQGTVQNGTYVVPQDIIDWPANGNTLLNQNLAPFFDVNADGLYAPLQHGDYPIIKGDQMLYWIFNDKLSNHGESGGLPLGVEVHASVYAFQCDSFPDSLQVVNNTVFYNFEVINRSSTNYYNFYIASFQDPDLQIYSDNAVATLPASNLSYSYAQSQDSLVDSLYNGLKVGAVILNGPFAPQSDGLDNNNNGQIDETNEKCLLNYSMNFRNDQSVIGNPQNANHFYQYMQSKWKDNTPLTYGILGYGGTTPVNYAFNGQPWDTTTWNSNESADWRIVQSAGPVNFLAGDTITFEYAFVNHKDLTLPWNLQSTFEDYFTDVQTISNLYNQGNIPSCISLDLRVKKMKAITNIKLFPNPAQHYFELQSNNEIINQVLIYDINGALINQYQINNQHILIDIQKLSAGIYFIQANCNSKTEHFKLIKQ